MACALFLLQKYKQNHDEEIAGAFASAITNTLFGDEPSKDRSRIFLEQNKFQIDNKIKELVKNQKFVHTISITRYMLGEVLFLKNSESRDKWLIRTSELQKVGIILKPESIEIPKSGKDFLRIANDFQNWVKEYS